MASTLIFNVQKPEQQHISIPAAGGDVSIPFEQLVCLEGEGNYTFVHTSGGKKYLVAKTLKAYGKLLDERIFVRIHKSTIINLNFVQGFFTNSHERIVKLEGDRYRAMSRRRAREIGAQFMNFAL